MKKLLVIFLLFLTNFSYTQDTILNNRYNFGYDYCAFSSVISSDSCYYIKSLIAYQGPPTGYKDGFMKINKDGTLNLLKVYAEDTIGLSNWESDNLINTLDNNFSQIITTWTPSNNDFFIFIKQSPNGDTLKTTLLDTINVLEQTNGGMRALWPSKLLQLEDSSFLCTATIENLNFQSSIRPVLPMLIKLDKQGNYLWHKIYWGFASGYYISRCFDFLQFDDSTFVMCNTYGYVDGNNFNNNVGYPKWLFIDSLGNIKKTIYSNDNNYYQNYQAYSFYKDNSNNFIYAGLKNIIVSNNTQWTYPIIGKVDEDFNHFWMIEIDTTIGGGFNRFNEVIPVSNTEYVALGSSYLTNSDTNNNTCGILVKFNTHGELLWQRKYVKVPVVENQAWPEHNLYDVDITPDSGFVMVGQAVNYSQNIAEPYGQLGWLVKTDKYGCLVPGCQMYDNPTEPIDSTDTTSITPPENVLYPNPANTTLYFYNTYSKDEPIAPKTCYIYNMQGQIVQQFTVADDKVTYIIDVNQLAESTYVFKVVSSAGQVSLTSRFVVVH